MVARSKSSNQRPDTLMQDRKPTARRKPLATRGRTIHTGQKAKYSLRADIFRFAPKTRHGWKRLSCPFRAKSGSPGRGVLDQIAGAPKLDCASLWKSCLAKAIDIHFSPPLTATGYIFGYSKMGLHLKEHGRRLPGFCISP